MGISRRAFLKYGVASASLAAGARWWPGRASAAEAGAPARRTYDVCVVGSGFAGAYLALRLVEQGVDTVLVEAGPADGSPEREDRDGGAFTSSGEVTYPVNQSRSIRLGGTSFKWSSVLNRLWPEDFRVRSLFGMDVDWPISYDDLEPYYCQAEKAMGAVGFPMAGGAEPARTCAYPHLAGKTFPAPRVRVGGEELRWFPPAWASRAGKRGRFLLADREIPDFRSSPHGTLLADHRAVRVVTLDGRTVDHVEVAGPGGARLGVRARHFVLAAGVVESARLLLLSRSKHFPDGLGNGAGLVGRHFTEHPNHDALFDLRDPEGLLEVTYRTHAFSDRFRREGLSAVHYQVWNRGRGQGACQVQWELEPRPENRVTLAADRKDALGNAIPELRFGYSERDRRTVARMMPVYRELIERFAAGPAPHSGVRWRYHPASVCRMGPDASSGVVDANCRVFGLENLHVSGGCVLPTVGTANPTLTIVALTLRLADHLAAKVRRP